MLTEEQETLAYNNGMDFVIKFTGIMSSEWSEKLEDAIAELLGSKGFAGEVFSTITGNTTVFPR